VARLASAQTKVVTLTVTEKGYCSKLATGSLDTDLPAVKADVAKVKEGGTALQTALGFLAAAALQRKAQGSPKLAVLSCDNVQENGHKMERCMLEFAELAGGPELRQYIEEQWTFPNSMVDRITPATTDSLREAVAADLKVKDEWPIISEDFIQWVVEDKFPAGRPPWEKVLNGACLLVEDVVPYELMKLRLLNGGHQSVAYVGVLAGHRTVDEAMGDAAVRKFVTQYMDSVGESVPPVPGVDFTVYKENLRSRFSNQVVKDTLLRLAEDGRNRIQVASIPCLEKMKPSSGGPVAALVVSWVRYLVEDTDDKGSTFVRPPDAAREQLEPITTKLYAAAKGGSDTETVRLLEEFLKAAFPPCPEALLALVPTMAKLLVVMANKGTHAMLQEV